MKTTKILVSLLLAFGLIVWQAKVSEASQMGAGWTYQGRLMDANSPADDLYDFQFKLFDDPNITHGNQVGSTIYIDDLDVIDGYFMVVLDFGSDILTGSARWLEIGVRPWDSKERHSLLSPRQEVTPTPYALHAKHADMDDDWMVSGDDIYSIPSGDVGIGTSEPESRLHLKQSLGTWGEGIRLSYSDHDWDIITGSGGDRLFIAQDQDITRGLVIHNGNVGIGTTSPAAKIHAISDSNAYPGVMGINNGTCAGVYGSCTNGSGIYGFSINNLGVYGVSDTGRGVHGIGNYCGVSGYNSSSSNYGYLGTSDYGVFGSSSICGVYGESRNCGVRGYNISSGNRGYLGGSDYGVYGSSSDGKGVHGFSDGNTGVYGEGYFYGVYGKSTFYGVYGISTNLYSYGVRGLNSGSGNSGYLGGSDYGVYGYSDDGYAGYFNGNVYVTENVSALSFTDRTPYPKDLAAAYNAVMSMERLPDGQYDENNKELQLDHSKLSDFVRSDDGNRDLSATVSCHNEILKDLIRKQKELNQAKIRIEKLSEQNRLLETRLAKLEAIVAQLNLPQEGAIK
jgi:hypothetical protein